MKHRLSLSGLALRPPPVVIIALSPSVTGVKSAKTNNVGLVLPSLAQIIKFSLDTCSNFLFSHKETPRGKKAKGGNRRRDKEQQSLNYSRSIPSPPSARWYCNNRAIPTIHFLSLSPAKSVGVKTSIVPFSGIWPSQGGGGLCRLRNIASISIRLSRPVDIVSRHNLATSIRLVADLARTEAFRLDGK
ncbi:hypothetical protein RRG08_018043 [Elysia crispata]|uniref:Uncharacterized protein n=1 Tax=Elysia crispata TaxID=231223 RepID=A0AAE0ZF15_9GAST|nr:hypothetical protein RRG08_018043 [Elysia crispata]